ncbi:MarR family winged helix-turn-helix transcriptional regulator [Wenyingzhuangia marina]|uniref:Transcriptional regulator, MarR family n=1 Tax=Wenyingzhuangia marina TaxID=1195760 RepID=A0A1M5V675_9FLAO|nr:MarR family transcriptional regulator [Wenyingzhuangia marina]GGF74091.1 MarR family transcriptional regulator [Wenyingzhuangia marina]SHH70767.1 transcriptional regulator, MarR family [Wenyingzhuangia marina]
MEENFENLYLENQLCFPLYAASRLTTKMYAPYLEDLDITYPQYLVLLVLWQYKEQSVSSIGQKLLLESNTLTPLLKRLEQKKLIIRKRSIKDERTVLISLTKEGKALKKKAVCIPEKIIKSFKTDKISLSEAIEFQKTLVKLMEGLKEKL